MKVLVIEDSLEMLNTISLCFKFRWPDVVVCSATTGSQGIEMAETASPDAIILDINLPDMEGFEVLKQIRLFSDVPIIIVTVRDAEMDRIKGLELNADDYIVKPFSPLDLLARMKTALRRAGMRQPSEENMPPFVAGGLTIDFSSREVFLHGQPVKLTPIEFKLLSHLIRNEGRVVSHRTLRQQVWGGVEYVEPSTVKKYIYQLHLKLSDTSEPRMICNERGVGYKFIGAPKK